MSLRVAPGPGSFMPKIKEYPAALKRAVLGGLLALALAPAQGVAKGPAHGGGNPGVAEIEFPGDYSKVVAVSDVHGMYKPLLALLLSGGIIDKAGNWTAGRTLLIVAGDSIDKGPDSLGTLDLWLALSRQAAQYGGRVIHLLGNHEAEFLADPEGGKKASDFRKELKAKGVSLKEVTRPGHARADFLLAMPVAARVGKWLFCHSGLLPDKSWDDFTGKAAEVLKAGDYGSKFLLGDDSILENRDWWESAAGRRELEKRLSAAGLFGVVFGHQGKALGAEGRAAVSGDHRLVKIDNGMPPEAGSHAGSLLIFPRPVELSTAARAGLQVMPSGGKVRPLTPG